MNAKFRQIYFALIFICTGNFCFAVVGPSSHEKINSVKKSKLFYKLKPDRNLNFKEKIILKIIKRKTRKQKKDSKKLSGMALTGFILGIAGLILPGLGILGLIFSLIALKRFKLKDKNKRGKDFAKLGVVLSIIGIILSLFALVIVFLFWGI